MTISDHLKSLVVQHDNIIEEFDNLSPQVKIWVDAQIDLGDLPSYCSKKFFSFVPEFSSDSQLAFEHVDTYRGDTYTIYIPYEFFDNVEQFAKEAEANKVKRERQKELQAQASAREEVRRLESQLASAKKNLEEGK